MRVIDVEACGECKYLCNIYGHRRCGHPHGNELSIEMICEIHPMCPLQTRQNVIVLEEKGTVCIACRVVPVYNKKSGARECQCGDQENWISFNVVQL